MDINISSYLLHQDRSEEVRQGIHWNIISQQCLTLKINSCIIL